MATTAITGYDGSASLTTAHNASLKTWRASFTRAVSDVTDFADTGPRRRLGMPDCSGSCGGTMNFDNTNTGPGVNATDWARDGVAITLAPKSASTACQYTMTAVVSNISMDVAKLGDATITFDFQLSGGSIWTETWDETA